MMPRPKTHTRATIASAAMQAFWKHGYAATSLQHLVDHTGASRQSIYADFGGKRALFLAALDCYQDEVVTPAFAQVETADADLAAVAAYFRHQIERAEHGGLPGSGCLVANTMTEIAPHDPEIRARVRAHNDRLHAGFLNALTNECGVQKPRARAERHLNDAAAASVIFAQGLWSSSRVSDNVETLHRLVDHYLLLTRSGLPI